MPKASNPGVPEGNEIIGVVTPFGGWVSTNVGAVTPPHFTAAIEGVEAPTFAKQNVNQYTESTAVSLWRKEHMGHLAPGQVSQTCPDASRYIIDLPVAFCAPNIANGFSYDYLVMRNGFLVGFLGNGGGTYQSFFPTGTPKSTNNCDVVSMYDQDSPQVEWIIWSHETTTTADIDLVQNYPYYQFNNWFSTFAGYASQANLKTGVPHKLCVGPDQNLYVTDGNNIRQITITGPIRTEALTNSGIGTTVAYNLNLGPSMIASSICSYKTYVAIGAYASSFNGSNLAKGSVKVFLWDGTASNTTSGTALITSTAAQYIYEIPDNYLNALHFDGKVLWAFTNGRNNSSKIWELTSKGFVKVFETPILGQSAVPIQGNIEDYQDGLLIGSQKQGENCYLFRYYGGGFHCEDLIGDVTNPATAIGAVGNLYQDSIFMGVASPSFATGYGILLKNNGLSTFQPNAQLKTILYTEGLLGRRQYPLGFKGTVNRIQIYLSQWGMGASLQLGLFKDYNATGTGIGSANDLLNLTLDTNTGVAESPNHHAFPVGQTEIDITDIAITDLSTFYMLLNWNHNSSANLAAIIRRMIIYWSPSQ